MFEKSHTRGFINPLHTAGFYGVSFPSELLLLGQGDWPRVVVMKYIAQIRFSGNKVAMNCWQNVIQIL